MPRFCVNRNAQSDGYHEVHNVSTARACAPSAANQLDLGFHDSCVEAVRAARRHFAYVDGCAYCAAACHTR